MSPGARPFIPGRSSLPTISSSSKQTAFRTNSVVTIPKVVASVAIQRPPPPPPVLPEKEKGKVVDVPDSWEELEDNPEPPHILNVKSTPVFSERQVSGVVYPQMTDRVRVVEEKWHYVPDLGLVYGGSLRPQDWYDNLGNDYTFSPGDDYYRQDMKSNVHKENYLEQSRGYLVCKDNLTRLMKREMIYDPSVRFDIRQDDLVLMRCYPRDAQKLVPHIRVLRCKKLGKDTSVVSVRGFDREVRTTDLYSINALFGLHRSFPFSDNGPVDKYCRLLCKMTDTVGDGKIVGTVVVSLPTADMPWTGEMTVPLVI